MPDYGHDLEFGYFLNPDATDPAGILRQARLLDTLGFDLIGIQDHPYQRRHLDTLSLIGVILGQTERIRVFPDVANLPLRPPAMLAKAAATLDQLSGGRFELGLGAGSFWEAIGAMGGPAREPKEALEALGEGVEIIRAMWSGQRSVRFPGAHYQVDGVRPGPTPAHDIGIWLGVTGPRAVALAGRVADGWVPSMGYVPPQAAARSSAILDGAARGAGRDPADIRRIYNVGGRLTASAPQPASGTDAQITGPVDHWVKVLSHFALDLGFASFILWSQPDEATLRTFIEEVAPGVRERVAGRRPG